MPVLIEATPYDTVAATRKTVRASSIQDRRVTGLNSLLWWPAVIAEPTFTIRLFDGDFSSDIEPGEASLSLAIDKIEKVEANVRRYNWAGSKLTIYGGNAGDAWPWTTEFKGVVDRWEAEGNRVKLTARVDVEPFQADVLTLKYAGTGGAEGGANLKNKPKPMLFGRAKSVEPVLIDSVNNVFQFHGYGPIEAVNTLYERAADFGAKVGDYASYAALVAATIPAGRWATCLAEGLIRLGAPPYGVITGDVDGDKPSGTWIRKTGAIISRIASNAGISSGLIDAASLTALDVAVPYNINLYVTEQTTVLDLARQLARPCNAQAGVSWTGKLFVVRIAIGSPALTLDAQGRRSPQVISSVEQDVSAPYWRIEVGAERCWRVHSFEEIATYVELIDRGDYSATAWYREGNLVKSQNMRWRYINATPGVGNAPPTLPTTSNSHWEAVDPKLAGIADGATADIPLALVSGVSSSNLALIGNTIKNIGADGSWVRCVVGPALANSASARMAIATGAYFTAIGLDDAATGSDYAAQSIMMFYRQSDGNCQIYRNGAGVANEVAPGAGKTGDIEARYDGVDYTLWVGDTKVATVKGVGANLTHYPKFWAYNTGWTFTNLRAGYFTDNNFTNIGGVNKPENNATHSEAIMQDDFSYASAAEYDFMWGAAAGGTATALGGFDIGTDTSTSGNRYNRIGNNAGNDFARHRWMGEPFAVESGVLYEIEIVWKQLNGIGVAKAGFEGLSTDKATIVGTDGTADSAKAHWVAMAGTVPAAAFTSYKGYLKGKAAAGSSTVQSDPASPGVFHNNVAFARPVFEINGPAQAGNVDIDKLVVRRVTQLAEVNADVASDIVGQAEVTVFADYLYAPKTGELSKVLAYKLFRAGAQVTAGITWSATLLGGNATFTITGAATATFTITGPNNATLADESIVRLTATPATGAARSFDVLIRKQSDAAPTGSTGGSSNPGTTVSTSSFSGVTSTSYGTATAGTLTATAGSAGQVRCTVPVSFKRTPGTAAGLTGSYGKVQWRVPAGVWADVAAETADSGDAETEAFAGEPVFNSAGSLSVDVTKTGLTSGTAYEFQFLMRKADTSGDVDNIYVTSGTFTAAGT